MNFKKLFLGLFAFVLFSSCNEKIEVVSPEFDYTIISESSTNAKLTLTASLVDSVAYIVTPNLSMTPPTAQKLFSDSKAQVINLAESDTIFTISGLEGATAYKVFLAYAFTNADNAVEYGNVIESESFTTPNYTDFVTVLENGSMYELKFHINIPEGDTVAYAVYAEDMYDSYKKNFGNLDADMVGGHTGGEGWDGSITKPTVNLLTESQTITFDGWYSTDPETNEETVLNVTPGQALHLIVAEITHIGKDYLEREEYKGKFDFDKYMDALGAEGGGVGGLLMATSANAPATRAVSEENFWLTELHYSKRHTVTPPKHAEQYPKVEKIKHTTKRILYGITPHKNATHTCASHVDVETYETIIDVLGYDGLINYITNNMSQVSMGDDQITYEASDLIEGMTYKLIIISNLSGDGTVHSVKMEEFSALTPTKPAPDMLVTALENAPEGNENSPWTVWYNVKCVSKDAEKIKYLSNDVREFTLMLNSAATYIDDGTGNYVPVNYTYESLIETYGVDMIDMANLDAVNSDEGLNMPFPAWEDTDTRLVVAGMTDEELYSNPDEDKGAIADIKSMPMPDAPRVESELFNTMKGEWTVELKELITVDPSTFEPIETPYISDEITSFTVNITDEPEYPATLNQSVYNIYAAGGIDKAGVDQLFTDFKASSTTYAKKVRGQNRLLVEGFGGTYAGYYDYSYQSPFDLFTSEIYSSAVTTSDLFFDFGPKWYLQIAEDGTISIPTDLATVPPVMNHTGSAVYPIAMSSDGAGYFDGATSFDTEISTNGDTITVLPKQITTDDGKEHTLFYSLGIFEYGYATPHVICGELKLIKGEQTTPITPAKAIKYNKVATSVKVSDTFNNTAMKPKAKVAKTVVGTPITLEQFYSVEK